MNKKVVGILFLFYFIIEVSVKAQNSGSIFYIANEGFLIETSNHKILIDAVFGNIKGNWCEQPSDSISNSMINGSGMFANIDAILITHYHLDHFNEQMVINFLKNNRKSVLICPDQVNKLLMSNIDYGHISNRVLSFNSSIQLDTLVTINKMNIEVMRLKHGEYFETDSVTGTVIDLHRNVENFGYFVEADGFTFLHTGDCSINNKALFANYKLTDKEIDVVFFDRIFFKPEGMNLINEFSKVSNFIFMHIEPGKSSYYNSVIKNIPSFFVFPRQNEKKYINN